MSPVIIPGRQAWQQARGNAQARWPSRQRPERLAPVAEPSPGPLFALRGDEKVFCIGSCFAREIETTLDRLGFEVLSLRPELPASPNRSVRDRRMFNKYNVGTILNELRWALDPAHPYRHDDVLLSVPGDLLVQDLQLRGEAWAEERQAAAAFREAFNRFFAKVREAEVVVLTLGLSEAWFDRHTGLYLNVAPTEHMVQAHGERFELHVLDAASTLAMLDEIDRLLCAHLRPGFKLLLTVSPVPLTSTFRDQDVLLANSYSKSLLRACCDPFLQGRAHARYFPSYEFATLSPPDLVWSDDDFRHVDRRFVDYLMASVLAGLQGASPAAEQARRSARQQVLARRSGAARWLRWCREAPRRWWQGLRPHPESRTPGHLDRWSGERLQGWGFDARHTRPLPVSVRVDGRELLCTTADGARPDVAQAHGAQRLHCGFDIVLPALPAGARQLSVHLGPRLLKTIALPGSRAAPTPAPSTPTP